MAFRPARHAASAFARTSASVSLWQVRRSECPTITALAPASLSISAERSPVKAPAGSAWQSWAPIRTGLPAAAAANSATRVAGGHTRISTAASSRAPSAIRASSATEARRPFIFQLPATSGRRGARAISRYPPFRLSTQAVSRAPADTPGCACDGLPPPRQVARQGPPPYDAERPPHRRLAGRERLPITVTHASRSTKSLFQLARQGGDVRRGALFGGQLRDLGHRRHFPRLPRLDGREHRPHRDHDRAVSHPVQRSAAAIFAPFRPADHPGTGPGPGARPSGDRTADLGSRAR